MDTQNWEAKKDAADAAERAGLPPEYHGGNL